MIQLGLGLFLVFALSRVVLQLKSAKLTVGSFLFWASLFVFALAGVVDPKLTTYLANWLGIGRGTDVVIYISIAVIFYLIFRLSITVEEIKREISEVIRQITLKEFKRQKTK